MTLRIYDEYPHLCDDVRTKSHGIAEEMLAPGETDDMTVRDWLNVTLDHLDQQALMEYRTAVQLHGEERVQKALEHYTAEP